MSTNQFNLKIPTTNPPRTAEELEHYATLRLMKFQAESSTPQPQSITHTPSIQRNTDSPYVICLDTYAMVEDLKSKLHRELRKQFQSHLRHEVKRQLDHEFYEQLKDIERKFVKQPKKHRRRRKHHRKSATTANNEETTETEERRTSPLHPILKQQTQINPTQSIVQSGNWIIYDVTRSNDQEVQSESEDFRPLTEVDLD